PRAVRVEVGRVGERVAHVARGEVQPAQARGEGHRRQECVIGDEDAEGAAEVEGREPDAAALLLLDEQEARDEEAGDDEEHAHAERRERCRDGRLHDRESLRTGEMPENDETDGNGAQPVQGRDARICRLHQPLPRPTPTCKSELQAAAAATLRQNAFTSLRTAATARVDLYAASGRRSAGDCPARTASYSSPVLRAIAASVRSASTRARPRDPSLRA